MNSINRANAELAARKLYSLGYGPDAKTINRICDATGLGHLGDGMYERLTAILSGESDFQLLRNAHYIETVPPEGFEFYVSLTINGLVVSKMREGNECRNCVCILSGYSRNEVLDKLAYYEPELRVLSEQLMAIAAANAQLTFECVADVKKPPFSETLRNAEHIIRRCFLTL